jgi:hypothetical protein
MPTQVRLPTFTATGMAELHERLPVEVEKIYYPPTWRWVARVKTIRPRRC